MRIKFLLFGLITLLLTSCSKKIDATSEDTFEASIEAIMESLNDDKKKEFEEALELILLNEFILQDGLETSFNDVKSKIDGKTASDIISDGKIAKEEIEKVKKEQARLEIEELYEKKAKADSDRAELSKFEVINSKFYKVKRGRYYITEEPVIEITVLNGTDQAISRAYFTGTLSSPNRTIPWHKDDFNHQISGGLEPNEEVTWKLAPSRFTDWGTVDAPKDAVLTVEVVKLDDANGDILYSIEQFDEDDVEALNELLKLYPEFKK